MGEISMKKSKQKTVIATLTVIFPKTKKERETLAFWLRIISADVLESEHKNYSKKFKYSYVK